MYYAIYEKNRHQPFMGLIGRREAARIQFITPAMQKRKTIRNACFLVEKEIQSETRFF